MTALLQTVAIVSVAVVPTRDDAKGPLKAFQGTWVVVGFSHKGRSAPPQNLAGYRVTFAGDRMTLVSPQAFSEYQVRLDVTARPKALTATMTTPQVGAGRLLGIYKLEGDDLTLALDMRVQGSERPQDFESKSGSSVMVWVLKRPKR